MAKKCIGCGRLERIIDCNYAGLDVRKAADHAFPSRIFPPLLKGNESTDFFCANCASRQGIVKCSFHGSLNDQSFSGKKAPICDKCTSELNEINKGRVPSRYEAYVPLSSLIINPKEILKEAVLIISDNGECHFINKEVLHSDKLSNFIFEVSSSPSGLQFTIKPINGKIFDIAEFTVNSSSDLEKASGTWIKPWKANVSKKLKLKPESFPVSICSHSTCTPVTAKFGCEKNHDSLKFVSIKEDKISTFPPESFPDLLKLFNWSLNSDITKPKLFVQFINDKIPCLITLKQVILPEGFESIRALTKNLPQDKKSNFPLDIEIFKACKTKIRVYPDNRDEDVLLYLHSDSVSVKVLSTDEIIVFSHGYSLQKCCLLVNENKRYATLDLNSALEDVQKNLKDMMSLPDDINSSFFLVFEKYDNKKIRYIIINPENVFMDSAQKIAYSNILSIKIIPQYDKLSEIKIDYVAENCKNETECFVAPHDYAYHLYKMLEIKRIKFLSNNLVTVELYREYHKIKKQNMLSQLFLGLTLLNRILNEDPELTDFMKKLESLEPEEFLKDKKLYISAKTKLRKLIVALPIMKKDFEYLASYYPYFWFETDINIIESSFGTEIANRVRHFERRPRVENLRRNIRNVQATLQRPLSEIERALHPVEQLFAIEKLRTTFFAYFLKFFPPAAQTLLLGTMVVTGAATGGVTILAGMLGISAVKGLFLDNEQGNKEKAAQIKEACMSIFSWWKVLNDTLPVLVYETADAIDIENQSTMNLDQSLFNKLPIKDKAQVSQRLSHELKKHIISGTQFGFAEVLKGSGIHYRTLSSELECSIKNVTSHTPKEFIGNLQNPMLATFRRK